MESLTKQFDKMGARIKLDSGPTWRRGFSIDIRRDKEGEYFALQAAGIDAKTLAASVVDLRPQDRHLLLLVKEPGDRGEVKHKFLCGHDERHWFVAAVPGQSVKNVPEAMEALKPEVVKERELQTGVKGQGRRRRKNASYIRQGEWFFIPEPHFSPDPKLVIKKEPIRRGNGGKPHMCELVYRSGGETVYVNGDYPNGLTQNQWNALCHREPSQKKRNWRVMARNAKVYAKGRVWHADHATIVLHGWHEVRMNRENDAPSMRHVAFLD